MCCCMKTNGGSAEFSSGSATWWLWPMQMQMPRSSKKFWCCTMICTIKSVNSLFVIINVLLHEDQWGQCRVQLGIGNLVAVADADADAEVIKKILVLYNDMYNKVSKLTLCDNQHVVAQRPMA